jgi:hypothetical protein
VKGFFHLHLHLDPRRRSYKLVNSLSYLYNIINHDTMRSVIVALLPFIGSASAAVVEHWWNISRGYANPDGVSCVVVVAVVAG